MVEAGRKFDNKGIEALYEKAHKSVLELYSNPPSKYVLDKIWVTKPKASLSIVQFVQDWTFCFKKYFFEGTRWALITLF